MRSTRWAERVSCEFGPTAMTIASWAKLPITVQEFLRRSSPTSSNLFSRPREWEKERGSASIRRSELSKSTGGVSRSLRSPGIPAFRCYCRWSKLQFRMHASPMTWDGLAQVEFVFQLSQSFVVDAPFVAQTDCGLSLQPKQFPRNAR